MINTYHTAKFWHRMYQETPHQEHHLAPIPVADILAMANAVLNAQAALETINSLIDKEWQKYRSTNLDVQATYNEDYLAGIEEAYDVLKHALNEEGN